MNRSPLGLTLCLALASAGFLAPPASSQVPSFVAYHPGLLHLELSQLEESHIELDFAHLQQVLCAARRGAGDKDSYPPGDSCRLVIANDGGGHGGVQKPEDDSLFEAAASPLAVQPCGTAQVSIVPSGLKLQDAGYFNLGTGCGDWTFKATLPANVSPLPTLLTLLPPAPGSSTGQFTGVLKLPLTFTYTSEDGETTYSESQMLLLDLAGRWTTLQTSGIGAPGWPATDSNLILFADRSSGAWFKRFGCGTVAQKCTRLCFDATARGIAALDAGSVSTW